MEQIQSAGCSSPISKGVTRLDSFVRPEPVEGFYFFRLAHQKKLSPNGVNPL
ncbi:hypothetical protein FHS54_002835 [Sphingobium vermicomposti]|uniref:Uncharacterized protein n=1 Tax=Sphingobium vermicomposti TaxID=529005 RepID=A0A846MGZ7_9SPHN|nr:hypothetical protein [Sphingobium vermicomposti]